ncbi:RHS repeat-associated core domain-containing protein, partial [Pseudoxanthomonas beigongshangi]
KGTYLYDGHGRRVRDVVNGVPKHSQYLMNGQLAFTADSRAMEVREYIYLGDDLVAIRERDATTNLYTTRYQHNDALGSALVETDANRAVLTRTEYEPYGLSNRPTLDGPGFTGHVQDAATGLTYMQQRYYDPVIGRFLSVDPVTALSNPLAMFNRYKYANNNPYRFTDPDGRTCQTVDGKASCVVDSYIDKKGNEIKRADMTKAQLRSVKGFEKSYTAAVNTLMANPSKVVTISMPGKPGVDGKPGAPGKQASTTSGEVGKALIGRNIVANSPLAGGGMATGGNTTYIGSLGLSGSGVIEGVKTTSNDMLRQLAITHEGLHGDGTGVSPALRGDMPIGPWNEAHQIPFNEASKELLDP